MKRIINDEKGQLDFSKIFWLCFWSIALISQLFVVDHLGSIAQSLRIISQVNNTGPTIVVPSTVTPSLTAPSK